MKTMALLFVVSACAFCQTAKAQGARAEVLMGYDHSGSDDGAVLGIRIGYDRAISSNVMLGVDGEWNDVSTERKFVNPDLTGPEGNDLYVGARLTYRTSPRFNVFAGAGYTHMIQSSFFFLPATNTVGLRRDWVDGTRLTAGAQLNIGRRAFLGVEYRYSNYGARFDTRNQYLTTIGLHF